MKTTRRRRRSVRHFCSHTCENCKVACDVCGDGEQKLHLFSLLFSAEVWLHQGEREDHDGARESETRDSRF